MYGRSDQKRGEGKGVVCRRGGRAMDGWVEGGERGGEEGVGGWEGSTSGPATARAIAAAAVTAAPSFCGGECTALLVRLWCVGLRPRIVVLVCVSRVGRPVS